MVGGVHFPKAEGLWLPPHLQLWYYPSYGAHPCSHPYHCSPKRGWAQSFVTCHMMSPNMGGISPACHNKVYYENRLVWGQRKRQIRLG